MSRTARNRLTGPQFVPWPLDSAREKPMNRPYHAPANQRPMAPSSAVPVNPPATRCRTKTATKTGAHLASRPLHNAFRPISEPTLVNSTAKPGRNKDASRKKREGQVKRVERKQKKRSRQKKILNETRRGPRVRFHGSKVAAAGVIRQLASSRSDDRGVNKTLEKLAQSTRRPTRRQRLYRVFRPTRANQRPSTGSLDSSLANSVKLDWPIPRHHS